ncbi:MAG: SRPBCC domain-containing protein [Candidatus Omnitrophica bacterium]|nr:SRPBCC domain-containing protein [Candidatus Omnitrophota bacterium]
MVTIERTLDATPAQVWSAITNKDEMKQWYFNLKEFKSKVGFKFSFDVEHKGMKYLHRCQVTKVIAEKKLCYTWRYEGHPGVSLVTWELFDEGHQTRLKLTHTGLNTFPPLPEFAEKNFRQGWTEIIGKSLIKYFDTSDRQIVITRLIDAPVNRIWKAISDPKQVSQWWGPNGFTNNIEKMEFKVGGMWKHVMRGPDGVKYPNKSFFQEIVKHKRIVYKLAGGRKEEKGANFIATWTFEPKGKKTKVIIKMVCETPKERDHIVKAYGAIEGGKQTLGRLAAFVK